MLLKNSVSRFLCKRMRSRHAPHHHHVASAMLKEYDECVHKVSHLPRRKPVGMHSVFANNELHLREISVYGFDYDYTLVTYSDELDKYTYDEGRNILVDRFKYPENIKHLEFNPHFAVRGLHYDVIRGLLMKVDAFHNIQLGTVYRGLTPVSDEEVMSLYAGDHIPKEYLNAGKNSESAKNGARKTMIQLMDLFALPEMNLLANVIQYFSRHGISYDAEYLYRDVKVAIQGLHKSGKLHQTIMDNIEKYLVRNDHVKNLLQTLKERGKRIFIISNSGFDFINAGLRFSVGEDWMDLFDVVIVEARKPSFFTDTSRPFRVYNPSSGSLSWGHVTSLNQGVIYKEGNLNDFHRFTGWQGRRVLYFGDHFYADLVDPSNKLGWRTGAIIPELEEEIQVHNSENFQTALRQLLALERLIERWQTHESDDSHAILEAWLYEREHLRNRTKKAFNAQFGSRFRTFNNQSYFSQRLSLCADLYMSSVTNLLSYSTNHTFYPRRTRLPHEAI